MENNKNIKYPSVTEILSSQIDKRWYTEEAREYGAHIHCACEDFLTNGIPSDYSHDQYSPCIKSFVNWLNITHPKPHTIEGIITDDELLLRGKPDFIGEIEGREGYGVIDWKTSTNAQEWWPLQLAAYKYLAERNYNINIEWIATVRIKKNGRKAIFNDYTEIYEKSLRSFLKAHTMYMVYHYKEGGYYGVYW